MGNNLSELVDNARAAIQKRRNLGLPKSEPIGRFVANLAEEAGIYPVPNIAVEICLMAYIDAQRELLDKGEKAPEVARLARLAYAASLPKLSNADCIRDYIACVVHGMGIGAILSAEGARLLYGAQVAHSALPGGKKRRPKRVKSVPNAPSSATPTQSASIA